MLGKDDFYQATAAQSTQSGKNKKKKKKGQAQASSSAPQRYIPGLNSADDANVIIPLNKATKKQAAKSVPAELVEEFLEGRKNPISALTEYGALQKLIIAFEECAVERPSIVARYATLVRVNGKPFPQGTGKTKKDAKTAAAKVALSVLLGLETEDVESAEDRGKIILDAYGRKMILSKDELDDDTLSIASSTASSKLSLLKDQSFKPQVALPSATEAGVRPLWDQPKNPVSSLTEYCSKNDFNLVWKVSDKPTEIGFKAEVFICDDSVAIAYALNKKDAKRDAALRALEIFCGGHEDGNDSGMATVKPSKPNPRPADEAESIASAPRVGGAPLNMPTYRGVSSVTHDDEKDHIEMLQDFCRLHKIVMAMIVSDNPAPNGLYEAYVKIDKHVVAVEEAETKKEAKRMAAKVALEMLTDGIQTNESTSMEGLSSYDKIAALSHLKFSQLLKEIGEKPSIHKYMSAFIIKRSVNDDGTVVALGSGNAVITPANRTTDGRSLNDCHSVVIAKRALLKYFHREMKMFYEGHYEDCIFERASGSHQLQLKDEASIHLYMSRAPCGDATLYNKATDGMLTPEMLETMKSSTHQPSYPSDDSGFTTSKSGPGFNVDLASEQAPETGSMSCSDKIMKWNTVGLQGSLYSNYLKPVYLNSITIGSLFDHGHLARALCCRLTPDIADYLPAGFRVNHAFLGRVNTCNPSHAQSVLTKESINWSLGDEKIEIIDPETGKSSIRSPFRTSGQGASRLAKAGFLFRFRDIARASNRKDLFLIPNYRDAKLSGTEYQAAKATLIEHLEVTGFGLWTKKSSESEMFTQ